MQRSISIAASEELKRCRTNPKSTRPRIFGKESLNSGNRSKKGFVLNYSALTLPSL